MRGKREKRVAQVAQTLLVRKPVVRMLDAGVAATKAQVVWFAREWRLSGRTQRTEGTERTR